MAPANPNFSDDSNDAACVECQYDADTPPSIAIVRSIAVLEDADPMESGPALGIRLHDHVDSEALDRLVTRNRDDVTLTIDLLLRDDHRYEVEICDTGQLTVEKLSET